MNPTAKRYIVIGAFAILIIAAVSGYSLLGIIELAIGLALTVLLLRFLVRFLRAIWRPEHHGKNL